MMEEIKIRRSGKIRLDSHGEGDDIVFLGDSEEPFAEDIQDWVVSRQVSVKYWISEKEMPDNDLKEITLRSLLGDIEVDYGHSYSETTGYLWTNEELNIGGHDLIKELSENEGKYLLIEFIAI